MTRLTEQLLTHLATGGISFGGAYALLRGKRVETEPGMAERALDAMKQTSTYQAAALEAKAETLRLRSELADTQAERDVSNRRLDDALRRLDEQQERIDQQQLQLDDLAQQLSLAASALRRVAALGLLTAAATAVPDPKDAT